jgi:hypothetical protein
MVAFYAWEKFNQDEAEERERPISKVEHLDNLLREYRRTKYGSIAFYHWRCLFQFSLQRKSRMHAVLSKLVELKVYRPVV